MKALVDYDSDGQSERGYSTSESATEAPEQRQSVPDVDAIIRETRAEMEQARLKADQLICQFAETYVDTAGQLRDASIQRYRQRLEGLPAEACAKVCETLAKDDIFCCNMDFGNGHLSYGGMSFTYKIESDAAFNALSHHAWKDLHQLFMKNQSPPLSGNGLEQGRPYVVHLAHYDEEEDGMEAHQDRSPSSSEESDSSSDEEDLPSSGDSDGEFGGKHRERHRSSTSPSPEWTTDDEAGSSGKPRRQGVGRPRKHKIDPDAWEKRGPGRPKSKPWSAEDEILMREKMALQLQRRGDLILRKKACMDLMHYFPDRTRGAIKNKWLDLKMKDTQDDLEGRGGKVGALHAKAKARFQGLEVRKHHDKDSGSLVESDTDNGDELKDGEVERGSHDVASWKWTPEQDMLLSKRMKSAMQSAGVKTMKPPLALQEELAGLFGRKVTAISRRWYFLKSKRKEKKRRRKEKSGPLVEAENGAEDKLDDREVKRGMPDLYKGTTWTPERDRLLVNRMKSEMQSAGVAAMPVPLALQKELGNLFSVHERTIWRRWNLISGNYTSSGNGKVKKDKHDLTPTLGKRQLKILESAPASSPQLQLSDDPGVSETAEESGPRDRSGPSKTFHNWSAREVEALVRLTKGLDSSGEIDFEEVAARLPSLTTRTAKACKVYWQRHLQSLERNQERNPTPEGEVPEQGENNSSRFDIAERSSKGEKRASDRGRGLTSHIQPNQAKSSSRARRRESKTVDKRNLWSRDEDDLLWRLCLSGIPWREVAAQIPGRSVSACNVRYSLTLINRPEYKERLNGQPGRLIRRRDDPKRDPELDHESPEEADTVVWGAPGSKHGRESDDEGEEQSAGRRKRHREVLEQSPLGGCDRVDRSEAEDSDELMYEFE